MTISSRTPEGDPNQCPICGHHVRLEPSIDTRDAPCPHCGHLLWFLDDIASKYPDLAMKWLSAKEVVVSASTKRLGPPPEPIRMALEGLRTPKFEKVEWNQLLSVNNWDDVVSMIRASGR
jgi:hypothetical protein